jgi:hypothetical protein
LSSIDRVNHRQLPPRGQSRSWRLRRRTSRSTRICRAGCFATPQGHAPRSPRCDRRNNSPPIIAWAIARLRSIARARSHSAMPWTLRLRSSSAPARRQQPTISANQDRGEAPGLAHGASAEARSPVARGLGMVRFHAALKRTWKQGAQPCVSARERGSGEGNWLSTSRSQSDASTTMQLMNNQSVVK